MTKVTLGMPKFMTLPNKEGETTEFVFNSWTTEDGLRGDIKIEKSEYSTEKAIELINEQLKGYFYADAGKTFELE